MRTGEIIKQRRKELKMTQDDLAKKIGLSEKSSISKMETEDKQITMNNLKKLTVALDCTVWYLLGITVDPHEEPKIHARPDSRFRYVPKTDPVTGETYIVEEDLIKDKPQQKTQQIQVPSEKVIVSDVISAMGSGRKAMPAKVTGVEVIDPGPRIRSVPPKKRIQKPVLSDREKLIKKIIELPDDMILDIADYVEYQILKRQGGE